MKSKFRLLTLLLVSGVLAQESVAGVHPNSGGLGCGTIVSMRESTQKPISSDLTDSYGGASSTGGSVFQVLSQLPGVGFFAAAAGDMVADVVVSSVSSSVRAADKDKQIASKKYKDVQAVEFRFDDGEVINIPMMVVSGMLYKTGRRLNAMVSPTYGNLNLGIGVMFTSTPSVGDSDYKEVCRIDSPEARKALLESVRNAVDESQIVEPGERRLAATTAVAQ